MRRAEREEGAREFKREQRAVEAEPPTDPEGGYLHAGDEPRNRLIRPDALDPAEEFRGQLDRLIRDYRAATGSRRDDELIDVLDRRALDLAREIGDD